MFEDEISVPICFKTCRNKGTFKLCPPTRVQVVGSFLLKTQAKFDANVDIAVEIPKARRDVDLSMKDSYIIFHLGMFWW